MPLAPRDIDYFLEVARQGQLALAAGHLDVTAAALSKAIRRLEQETGLPLFDRSGQGMKLTPYGASFHERAQRIKAGHDEALRHAGDVRAGRAGLLRIGTTIAVLESAVSPALASLQPRRPGLHATLAVASSDEVFEQARKGNTDIAVAPTYDALPHGLEHETLGTDELVPVVREGHPLLRRKRLDLAMLAEGGWILPRSPSAARVRFDAVFKAGGAAPPAGVIEVDFNASWSLPLVAGTDLLAIVPRSALAAAGSKVQLLEFAPLRLSRAIRVFWRRDVHRTPLMDEFVLALKEGFTSRKIFR